MLRCLKLMSAHPGLHAAFWQQTLMQLCYKLGSAYCYQQIFDEGVTHTNAHALYEAVAILAGLLLLFAIALLLQERVMSVLGMHVANRLRNALFVKLLALSPRFHAKTSPSELIDRMGNDVGAFEVALVRALPIVLVQGSIIVSTVVLLFIIEWRLALVVLASMPITLLISKPFGNLAATDSQRASETRGRLLALTQEAASGHLVIRLFGIRDQAAGRFRKVLDELGQRGARAHFFTGLIARSAHVASGITQLIVIGFGGWLAYSGYMTAGMVVAFVGMLMEISSAVNLITGSIPIVSLGAESLARIDGLLQRPGDLADPPDSVRMAAPEHEIRFSDVSFAYEDRPVLSDISFVVRPGELVAFVGPSGAGKSTVLALLTRLYEPQRGHILFDSTSLASAQEASLREVITGVPQAPILFQGSIRENLAIARPAASDVEIEAAARAAAIHDLISDLPDGYATQVGEAGGALSGGQQQRIAIARAFLRDAPILALDEATSALDSVSEAQVNRSIAALAGRRTVFVVTHRLASIAEFDRIFVFDKGRLVQSGRHADLLAANGLYATLWESRARESDVVVDMADN